MKCDTLECLLENNTVTQMQKYRQGKLRPISVETIYAWIYQKTQKRQKLWKNLPRHKAKRGLRKSTAAGTFRIPQRTNGRLRRDLPRGTDVKAMSREDFDEIIENYNTTPRKTLGWQTPLEVFNRNLSRVALRT